MTSGSSGPHSHLHLFIPPKEHTYLVWLFPSQLHDVLLSDLPIAYTGILPERRVTGLVSRKGYMVEEETQEVLIVILISYISNNEGLI